MKSKVKETENIWKIRAAVLTDNKAGHECSRAQFDGWLPQKMSTTSWWSYCSHSLLAVFSITAAALTSWGGDEACLYLKSRAYASAVFVSPKNKKEAVSKSRLKAAAVWLVLFVPSCLSLKGILDLITEAVRTYGRLFQKMSWIYPTTAN